MAPHYLETNTATIQAIGINALDCTADQIELFLFQACKPAEDLQQASH